MNHKISAFDVPIHVFIKLLIQGTGTSIIRVNHWSHHIHVIDFIIRLPEAHWTVFMFIFITMNCWINFYWLLRTQLNPRKITNLIWQINFFHQTCQRRGRIFNNKTHNLSSYYHTNIFDFYIFVPFLPRPKCERLRVIFRGFNCVLSNQ
jgi:hypothetical protein